MLSGPGPRPARARSFAPFSLKGIVVDNSQAKLTGQWLDPSSAKGPLRGQRLPADGNQGQGENSLPFPCTNTRDGKYAVRWPMRWARIERQALQVIVRHATGVAELRVDQRKTPPIDGLMIELGVFSFKKSLPAEVEVRNDGARWPHVLADAVQWLPVEK